MLVCNKDIDGDLFKIFRQLLWSVISFQPQPIDRHITKSFCFATYICFLWLAALLLLTLVYPFTVVGTLHVAGNVLTPGQWESY